MFNWIKKLINKIKQERAYRKRLKELKKKLPDDPQLKKVKFDE